VGLVMGALGGFGALCLLLPFLPIRQRLLPASAAMDRNTGSAECLSLAGNFEKPI
jgi:hypothetical protein